MSAVMNEYIEKLHDIRKLLIKAHLQKKEFGNNLGLFKE